MMEYWDRDEFYTEDGRNHWYPSELITSSSPYDTRVFKDKDGNLVNLLNTLA